jgi:GNAT superfamily N-acetyltransferase
MRPVQTTDEITFRPATRGDLDAVVALLAHDDLGMTREAVTDELSPAYIEAFEKIEQDPGNEVIVAEDAEGIAGTMQLTYISNLTFQGAARCQIEGVRIAERIRIRGLGREMFLWATERARVKGCRIVQLTSNKARDGALAFYEKLGYEASHIGFKLYLD